MANKPPDEAEAGGETVGDGASAVADDSECVHGPRLSPGAIEASVG